MASLSVIAKKASTHTRHLDSEEYLQADHLLRKHASRVHASYREAEAFMLSHENDLPFQDTAIFVADEPATGALTQLTLADALPLAGFDRAVTGTDIALTATSPRLQHVVPNAIDINAALPQLSSIHDGWACEIIHDGSPNVDATRCDPCAGNCRCPKVMPWSLPSFSLKATACLHP